MTVQTVLDTLQKEKNSIPLTLRRRLAQKVFAYTAQYDAMIANYLSQHFSPEKTDELPDTLTLPLQKAQTLRYGENPQQAAAFYTLPGSTHLSWELKQGKPLSFNNLVDADVAWNCVKSFDDIACVIVKHANPCGVAIADNLGNRISTCLCNG